MTIRTSIAPASTGMGTAASTVRGVAAGPQPAPIAIHALAVRVTIQSYPLRRRKICEDSVFKLALPDVGKTTKDLIFGKL